jgi:GT2 family glycosyltransferase
MDPELSVVVSTLGNQEGLRRVLDGYSTQDAPASSFEVIVAVDAAERDLAATGAAIGERTYPVRFVRGEIPGLSANRNAGIRAATAMMILFTDNDTIPQARLVSEHLGWHRRYPEEEVGILGHVRWSREVRVTSFMHWLDHGVQFDFPLIDGIEAGWGRFYGANVSVKRSFAERVGGFDQERLPYGYEDLDFGYRASKNGLRLLYNRDAVVEHLREMSLTFFKQRVRRTAYAEREFVRKHPELEPYFFRMFSHAAKLAPVRGRGRHLIRWIPRETPWVGPRVWLSADLYYRQALASDFLSAWDEAGAAESSGEPVAPRVSELDLLSSGGSVPGGPK